MHNIIDPILIPVSSLLDIHFTSLQLAATSGLLWFLGRRLPHNDDEEVQHEDTPNHSLYNSDSPPDSDGTQARSDSHVATQNSKVTMEPSSDSERLESSPFERIFDACPFGLALLEVTSNDHIASGTPASFHSKDAKSVPLSLVFTFANSAFEHALGTSGPFIRRRFSERWPRETRRAMTKMLQQVISSLKSASLAPLRINPRHYAINAVPIGGTDTGPMEILLTLHEVPHFAEEEGDSSNWNSHSKNGQKNTINDEMLSILSHELRTPLNAILGWTQLLLKGKAPADRAAPIIEQNAKNQAKILDDVMEMGRLLSDTSRLNPELTRLGDIIWSTINEMKDAADTHEISLQAITPSNLKPLETDPTRLRKLLLILLEHAVTSARAGSAISVIAEENQSEIEVRICQTENGTASIRNSDANSPDPLRRDTPYHANLNLAVARRLAMIQGGSLRIEDMNEPASTCFIITLPLTSHAAAHDQHTAMLDEAMLPDGVTVLAVDDEPHAVELLKHVLGDRGAQVIGATSAEQALKILDTHPIDLLISDIGMPETDGYSLIKTIRAYPDQRRKIPAIALTAFARSQDKIRALESGFTTHLVKPIDINLVVHTVRLLLGDQGTASSPSPFAM